jgi:uncharacterized membrane protein
VLKPSVFNFGFCVRSAKNQCGSEMPSRLIICLGVLYPVLVYFGNRYLPPQALAVLLVLLVLGRRTSGFGLPTSLWSVIGGLLLAVLAFGLNNSLPLKMYPVLVNGSLLVIFLSSLRYPPTIAERLARLRDPDLPQAAVAYTRKVTQAWCIFFAGNALIALWTALRWPDRVWFYYNGIIAYVLVGVMFAGEWMVRQRVLPGYQSQ